MGVLHPIVERVLVNLRGHLPDEVSQADLQGFVRRHGAALNAELTAKLQPRVAEAFAGGGLFSLALHAEGCNVVDVCELDKHAVSTLQANFYPEATPTDAWQWMPPVGLDLLCGGPPCQPWSQGGALLGRDDPRNAYPRLLEWLREAQPATFLWENSDKIARIPKFTSYIDGWRSQARALGYETAVWVTSAADYGTPQNRLRAWIVGWKAGSGRGAILRSPPPATHGHPDSDAVRSGELLPWVQAFDRVSSGCCGGYALHTCRNAGNYNGACETCVGVMGEHPHNYVESSMTDDSELSERQQAYLAQLKGNRARVFSHPPAPGLAEAWSKLPAAARRVSGYLAPVLVKNLMRGAPYGLIATDQTPDAAAVDRDDPVQLKRYIATLRRMSVRTAARLQDLPNWYDFPVSPRQARAQIGNGIPVELGRAVVRHMLKALGYESVRGSMTSEGRHGLWSSSSLDTCARFPGIQGYPGGHWVGSVPERESFDPHRRPVAHVADYLDGLQRAASAAAAANAWLPDGHYNLEALPKDGSFPPGFPDEAYLYSWLDGESEDTVAAFAAAGWQIPW